MSFPRAKIQRFNDVLNSVPSPTKYDPKIGDKVKGGCILKGETKPSNFSDTASATSSKSCQTPVFRTPQLPKKHNCLIASEKGSHSAFKSISFKSEDLDFLHQDVNMEELKSLRVECSNKTETINDLEAHIQELKAQILDSEKSTDKLKAYILELEIAKSNLECMRDNHACEQISKLNEQLKETEKRVEELIKDKEELLAKMEEAEKKNSKLEELNLDCERKIISLEGTIEQLMLEHKDKEKLLAELKQNEEVNKMNNQISIECLKGKISTLENEIKEMDSNRSKDETTIFGLETEISNLNCLIEKIKAEKSEMEISSNDLKSRLEKMETDCKIHDDTITGLEMELENKIKEIKRIGEINDNLKADLDGLKEKNKEKQAQEETLKEMLENQETLKKLIQNLEKKEKLLEFQNKEIKDKCLDLINGHAEEILQIQNEYESKVLAQMQENTDKITILQCQLDEKDYLIKQSQIKYSKIFAEWEMKLKDAENNFSLSITKLESDHLERIEEIKKDYLKKVKAMEKNSSETIDLKNKEIDMLTEQYKAILGEVNELLKDIEKKDLEIKKISSINYNLNSRLKVLLEEIKLLNKENDTKSEDLKKMTVKYQEEFGKNEQLSCKLGESDCKIAQLKEDLRHKVEDWRIISEELRQSKFYSEKIQNKKLTLEKVVDDLHEKVNKLNKEMKEKMKSHDEEMKKAEEELAAVKLQCRSFEIIMGNTRKSLEAVKERLIESENEVEKLNEEKEKLEKELKSVENERDDFKIKYEDMFDTKCDLEAALDEYTTNNKELSQKCESLHNLCCEFELKINELTALNQELETKNQKHIQAITGFVNKQEFHLIQTERETLEQVENVSQMLMEKLEFFMKFSTEKIQNLAAEVEDLKTENEKLTELLKTKSYDYDNLATDNEILKTTVEITVKESENLKKKYEDQNAALKKLEEILSELKKEKQITEEKLVKEKEKLSNVISECEILRKETEKKDAELKEEMELRCQMETEINSLKVELEENSLRTENKDNKIKGLEIKILQMELKIREKDTEIVSCKEKNSICLQEVKELNAAKGDLLFEIKTVEKKLEMNEKLTEEIRKEKLKAEEDLGKQNEKFEIIEAEKQKVELELAAAKAKNEKLWEEIANLEERKSYYKNNCMRLEKRCAEVVEEKTSLNNDFYEIHSLLKGKEAQVAELEKECAELKSLIGPFRDHLEQYENEKQMIENDREQLRQLHLEQAAKLGHQNLKQKIRHVVNLKNNLLQTRKENEKLQLEIKCLKKKVQKLQEALGEDSKRLFIGGKRPAAVPFKGKENRSTTPALITPVTVKQEPVNPGSPLRNRNQ